VTVRHLLATSRRTLAPIGANLWRMHQWPDHRGRWRPQERRTVTGVESTTPEMHPDRLLLQAVTDRPHLAGAAPGTLHPTRTSNIELMFGLMGYKGRRGPTTT
jgi:hypothetical protein